MYRHIGQAFLEFSSRRYKAKWVSCPERRTFLWLLTGWRHHPQVQITGPYNIFLLSYFGFTSCLLSVNFPKLSYAKMSPWHCLLSLFVPIFKTRRLISSFSMPNKHGTVRRCSEGVSVDSQYPTSSSWSKSPSKLSKPSHEFSTSQLTISKSWQCLLTTWKLCKTGICFILINFHFRKVCLNSYIKKY